MSINAACVSVLANELNELLSGGRIEKIRQPSKELILLTVRNRGVNSCLLLSASASGARIHITKTEYESPQEPPMFCMLLRKHLLGAEITEISQEEGDRIVSLTLSSSDELGRSFGKKLVIEMIPGKINIILVGSDGIIIDCIHRRDYETDLYRRVFPGMIYRLPERPAGFSGTSAASSSDVRSFTGDGFSTVSEFLDAYYSDREKKELYLRKSKELRTSLNSARKRIEKKLAAQKTELHATASRDLLRRNADLITGNIYRIKKGDSVLVCEDYYEEGSPEKEIELDPLLTPQENAAKLYKNYNRMKTAEEYLSGLVEKAEQQLEYIGSVMFELEKAATDAEIDGIREELTESGIIRSRLNRKLPNKKGKRTRSLDYITSVSPNGLDILAGRNNLQNDELTFSVARKSDLWFHVKDYHGSHVILRTLGSPAEEKDIMAAAALAAENSQAGLSGIAGAGGRIPVNYTEVRYVKKRSGALPGNVIYTNQKTVFI